jgi:hypothetical protein
MMAFDENALDPPLPEINGQRHSNGTAAHNRHLIGRHVNLIPPVA